MVWPKCLRWREGEEPEAQASLPSLFTGGSGVPVCCAVFGETGQGGGNAVSDPPLQTQHHRNLLCSKSRCCFDGRSELHRLFLCQWAHHDAEVILPNTVWSVYSKIRCFTMFNFLFLFFFYSLPSLRPLIDINYLPLTDMRIARTFCFSNLGQALYLTSPTEIQRITYSQETCDNLQVRYLSQPQQMFVSHKITRTE